MHPVLEVGQLFGEFLGQEVFSQGEKLAEKGETAVPLLCELLKHDAACYWACLVLADIGPNAKDAVPVLQELLKHKHPEVRIQALVALGKIGPAVKSAAPAVAGSPPRPSATHAMTPAIRSETATKKLTPIERELSGRYMKSPAAAAMAPDRITMRAINMDSSDSWSLPRPSSAKAFKPAIARKTSTPMLMYNDHCESAGNSQMLPTSMLAAAAMATANIDTCEVREGAAKTASPASMPIVANPNP